MTSGTRFPSDSSWNGSSRWSLRLLCGECLAVWLVLTAWTAYAQAPAETQPAKPTSAAEKLLLDESLDSEIPESIDRSHPLVPALRVAYASRRVMNKVQDYTGLFVKREVVNGKIVTHRIELKVREEPFSVYGKFQDPYAGRQILYVQGANDNKLLVRETGLKRIAGTVPIDPQSDLAMAENRYPITQLGLTKLLDTIIAQWELEGKYGEINVEWYPDAKLGTHPCPVIQTSHPYRRRQFKFHKTLLYLDGTTLLPVRVEQYDWPQQPNQPAPQMELYMYSDIRTNVGLKPIDFDQRNPNFIR